MVSLVGITKDYLKDTPVIRLTLKFTEQTNFINITWSQKEPLTRQQVIDKIVDECFVDENDIKIPDYIEFPE